MNLEGRIIVVTGGARGLGRAFAEACAKALLKNMGKTQATAVGAR